MYMLVSFSHSKYIVQLANDDDLEKYKKDNFNPKILVLGNDVGKFIASFYKQEDMRSSLIPRLRYQL